MAAPALSIVELAEDERTVLLRANISEGGDADLSNLVLADIANYAAVGPEAVALSIRRVWWSLENMNVELKFEADTPVKALTLSGNGNYDFSDVHGLKNPGGSGSTGSILLDTYGIEINAALGCVGSLVIELWKVRSGEAGGDLDSEATSSLFNPEVPEVSGGIIIGGNSAASGYIQLLEDSDNGSNYIQVQAPASLAGNVTLTLPENDGDASQFLQTNGSGVLSWATVDTSVDEIVSASASGPAQLLLAEDTDNGSNKVTIQAPASLAADYTLTLPANDGDNLQVLQTDGSGVLSWATVSGSGASTEQGTWTASIKGYSGDPTTTHSNSGRYFKVGTLVYVTQLVSISAVSGGSGTIYLGNLPFEPLLTNNTYYPFSIGYATGFASSKTPISAVIPSNISGGGIAFRDRTAVDGDDAYITTADVTTSTLCVVSGCYIATS